jgi:DNA-binding transcriptional MocR family regulator
MSDEKPVKIRRKAPREFAMTPHAFARDPSLSDKAFRLWIVLQSHADYDDRDCHPYQSTLATEMGCSRVTIWRVQNELIERGLLEIESGRSDGSANIYTVLDPLPNPEGPSLVNDPPIASARHPSIADETPGLSSVKDKGNENQLTRIIDDSEGPELSPVDMEPDPELPHHIAELRIAMDPTQRKAVGQ